MSGPVAFLGRIDSALASDAPAKVAANAQNFAAKRYVVAGDHPQFEELRDRARAIRMETLAELDTHLARFADAAEAVETRVHWAADAAEANEIIVGIAKAAGAETAVKGKSMVTEEIELNEALEEAGLEVTETDLGEFIAQLAGEKPSHIIAPILHKSRQDVGHVFTDELGEEYTDDPDELNAIAQRHLRQRFLTADIGISGVNMAVAENGSLALIENEGNGRFTTTAPPIHIAVMGMERIVPTMSDAAVVLDVLARSATAQPLTVYTNFINGPRWPGDPDGPDELHVVIVDNGRSATLGSATAEILGCIRCGACLNICPVYQSIGGHAYDSVYQGPVGSVVSPGLWGLDPWSELSHASTLCGACEEVCPIRIAIPDLLAEVRAQGVEAGLAPGWLASGISRYEKVTSEAKKWRRYEGLAAFGARFIAGSDGWMKRLPSVGKGWTDHRDLPAPSKKPFRDRWEDRDGT